MNEEDMITLEANKIFREHLDDQKINVRLRRCWKKIKESWLNRRYSGKELCDKLGYCIGRIEEIEPDWSTKTTVSGAPWSVVWEETLKCKNCGRIWKERARGLV